MREGKEVRAGRRKGNGEGEWGVKREEEGRNKKEEGEKRDREGERERGRERERERRNPPPSAASHCVHLQLVGLGLPNEACITTIKAAFLCHPQELTIICCAHII